MMFHWFNRQDEFMAAVRGFDAYRIAAEAWIESRDTVDGYCGTCEGMTTFAVTVGGYYGPHPNLREAMKCPGCNLSNRNRLLHEALKTRIRDALTPRIALLERTTPLFSALQREFPDITGSEYLGEGKVPGSIHAWHGFEVRHESITDLSFDDASLDFLLHCDVLEHVHDYRRALREAARVLDPDRGTMLCTVPFFMTRIEERELARPRADGSIEYFGPPEYHGDGLRPEGILTWHHFGWKLLDDVRAAGFAHAAIGLAYDPFRGYTTNNHPTFDYGLMHPLVLYAER
jgi:SAM-dependent methyltransferase